MADEGAASAVSIAWLDPAGIAVIGMAVIGMA
jgi:hypothetical protein